MRKLIGLYYIYSIPFPAFIIIFILIKKFEQFLFMLQLLATFSQTLYCRLLYGDSISRVAFSLKFKKLHP